MNKNITMLIISFLIVAVIGVMQQSTSYEQSNFGDTVVFYPQHEDDETLWAGSAILEAIKERGADNVYVVLVSYGTGIKVFKDEKYSNLSNQEKYEYREREFLDAVKELGVKKENIILLPRSGKIKHALYFIKPRYEKDLPISEKIIYKSETTMEKQRIKKACMAYKIIDEKSKREGIGYKSDHKSFEDLMIKNRSILHTPNN